MKRKYMCTCLNCGLKYEATSTRSNFCSRKCRNENSKKLGEGQCVQIDTTPRRKARRENQIEITRIAGEAEREHMSYGKYVAQLNIDKIGRWPKHGKSETVQAEG